MRVDSPLNSAAPSVSGSQALIGTATGKALDPARGPRYRFLRSALAGAALLAVPALHLGALAQGRRLTPGQTEGPFYPVQLPKDSDFDLLRNGAQNYAKGQPVWLSGSVSDPEGRPLRGAQVEIWQCDEGGHYHHPGDGDRADPAFQGFGRVTVDAQGQYRFRTIRPVAYGGRTPHIHVKVKLGTRQLLTTQLYVAGEARNERDFLWRSLSPLAREDLSAAFSPGSDGLQARFEMVVTA